MTADNWLREAATKLERVGIGTARLDALVLLEDVSGRDRAWLLAHPEQELSSAEQAALTKLLNRRAEHQPLAYVRGKTEFYGRTFVITPAVLEPRPESETMIDLLKQLPDLPAEPRIADVGAGSGAIGITAKLELPSAQVELLEIDPAAIKIAQKNVDLFTTRVNIIESDLLQNTKQTNDILLCNLPYVPDDYAINPPAMREPHLAIFGGPDGLDIYRRLFHQVKQRKHKPLYILCESLPPQHELLTSIASGAGYNLCQTDDFIQVFQRNS
ncbi:MAG TPA: HemK/PrmC family methyltransferase [Candidatus Saccharimonadales bacterium]|nr:HemK/PrmC family methyltransferase [Candidatus Saccharimonadales bacterium]